MPLGGRPRSARCARSLSLFVIVLLAPPACVGAHLEGRAVPPVAVAPAPLRETDFHCARAVMDRYSPYRMPLAGREEDPALAGYLAPLPPEARRAALAAGLEPLLARLLRERAVAGVEPTPRLLALQQELTQRLVAFHAQLAAAAFEAGCTADMIQKLLAERAHHEQSRQVTIAVGSLVAGAIAGVAAGVWGLTDQESRGPPILAIAGGVASTALGAAALTHQDPAVEFEHPRNRLAPLWLGDDPQHLYPSFVFRMMTLPPSPGARTPRDELIAVWQQHLDDAARDGDRAGIQRTLLGDGGVYDEQLLTLRAEMFESLESAVHGVARDLELLNRSIVRALTEAPVAGAPPTADAAPPPAGSPPDTRP